MSVRSFASLDELFAAESQAQSEANSTIKPFQEALKPGDCFCYFSADMHPNIVIWGEVLQTDPDDEDVPAGFELQPEFRFTRCHSVACPEGELGDIHISVVQKVITRGTFEKAKAAGWPHDEASFRAFAAKLNDERGVN